MNLLELIGELSTTRVTIRGREVTVRALTADELSAVHTQLPLPKKRQSERKNHDTGRMELFFDEQHPAYISAKEAVEDQRCALFCGIGLGIDTPDGPWRPEMDGAAAVRYAKSLTTGAAGLTAIEITRILLAQRDIVSPPEKKAKEQIGTETSAGN